MSDLIVEGRLEYLGWQRPWLVETEAGPVDLSAHFWRVAQALTDQPTTMECDRDAILIRRDENSDMILKHGGVGQGVYITKVAPAFGFSNVLAYLEEQLCSLNARQITAIVTPDADSFSIHTPKGEDVPGVRYFGGGNMCRVPEGMETEVCGISKGKGACIFLTFGVGTFQCAKFAGSMGRTLLERHATGTMNAGRIGNCKCVGREEAAQ